MLREDLKKTNWEKEGVVLVQRTTSGSTLINAIPCNSMEAAEKALDTVLEFFDFPVEVIRTEKNKTRATAAWMRVKQMVDASATDEEVIALLSTLGLK